MVLRQHNALLALYLSHATRQLFQTTFGGTPIEVDFQGWDDLPDVRQVVTFEQCIFEDLTFGKNNAHSGEDYPTLATLILATHPKNTLNVRGRSELHSSLSFELPCLILAF